MIVRLERLFGRQSRAYPQAGTDKTRRVQEAIDNIVLANAAMTPNTDLSGNLLRAPCSGATIDKQTSVNMANGADAAKLTSVLRQLESAKRVSA